MKKVQVHDRMQNGYTYELVEPMGENFDTLFTPELTPKDMLELGVFGGKYLNDCWDEFPEDWFIHAKISDVKNVELNYFSVDASQPLSEWQKKGWIRDQDPRGWFQWYCRYFMGRRTPLEDERQIRRWQAFRQPWPSRTDSPGSATCWTPETSPAASRWPARSVPTMMFMIISGDRA